MKYKEKTVNNGLSIRRKQKNEGKILNPITSQEWYSPEKDDGRFTKETVEWLKSCEKNIYQSMLYYINARKKYKSITNKNLGFKQYMKKYSDEYCLGDEHINNAYEVWNFCFNKLIDKDYEFVMMFEYIMFEYERIDNRNFKFTHYDDVNKETTIISFFKDKKKSGVNNTLTFTIQTIDDEGILKPALIDKDIMDAINMTYSELG